MLAPFVILVPLAMLLPLVKGASDFSGTLADRKEIQPSLGDPTPWIRSKCFVHSIGCLLPESIAAIAAGNNMCCITLNYGKWSYGFEIFSACFIPRIIFHL
ncbi:hypothetical protein ABVK25_008027 [Lepraria finkii]|uniref:Uncharacterized protein n=1 Tax=Lepraria finkii TaxID=1340010 RepID=A0ABR4B140_9LECA